MGPMATVASEKLAGAVAREAIDEINGTSNKKWGVALVAFAVGIVVAVIIIRRRGGRLAVELDEVEAYESVRI